MEKKNPIRVLIADDHPIFCEGLRQLINRRPDMTVVAEARSGREALALFRQHRPDLSLLDLRMPNGDGVETMKAIRAEEPTAKLIALTTYDADENILRALRAGAQAYLLKDAPRQELISCIRAVHRGETYFSATAAKKLAQGQSSPALTNRELEVLRLLSTGMSNREIGAVLSIAEGTVKLHVNNLMTKLEAENRVGVVTSALKRGILRLD
jgi:two-component system NarL family response regulator